MKVYIHDDFTEGSINPNKWTVNPTVTVLNNEAVVQETMQPGDAAVAGMLTSKVSVPPSAAIHFDCRFITNTALQSGTGFWQTDNVFFRKTNPDWTQGENMQVFLSYHVDTDAVVEVILYLYHRSPTGAALVGKTNIPLDLLASLDVEGTGALIRDLTIVMKGKKFTIKVGAIEVDEFEDATAPNPISPVQFGAGGAVNLTALCSFTNVLVTSL